jgi:hypothetical protein
MKKLWVLAAVVLGVVAWVTAVAAASTADVPFHVDGSGTLSFGQGSQSGQITGTQIGSGTASGTFTVAGFPPPCSAGGDGAPTQGSQTLTAADGSTINQQLVGGTCQSGPNSFRTTSTYTITGGSGRFVAATGTGTHVRDVDFPNGFGEPGTFTIHQDGTINLH